MKKHTHTYKRKKRRTNRNADVLLLSSTWLPLPPPSSSSLFTTIMTVVENTVQNTQLLHNNNGSKQKPAPDNRIGIRYCSLIPEMIPKIESISIWHVARHRRIHVYVCLVSSINMNESYTSGQRKRESERKWNRKDKSSWKGHVGSELWWTTLNSFAMNAPCWHRMMNLAHFVTKTYLLGALSIRMRRVLRKFAVVLFPLF